MPHTKNMKPVITASRQVPILALAALLGVSPPLSCRSHSGQPRSGSSEEPSPSPQERMATLTRQEQILSAEVSVAKNPTPYLSVDLETGKIELRARGRSLRSFPISKNSWYGGSPRRVETWEETDARPLQLPERSKMVPGSGEDTTSSIAIENPWGPKRMPLDYDLICKEDRLIGIRSLASAQSRSRFTRWAIDTFRQSQDWVRNILGGRKSAYRESLEIWLSEDHAQLLFWSLPKHFTILILNGS